MAANRDGLVRRQTIRVPTLDRHSYHDSVRPEFVEGLRGITKRSYIEQYLFRYLCVLRVSASSSLFRSSGTPKKESRSSQCHRRLNLDGASRQK
jgi:hypothetical protein